MDINLTINEKAITVPEGTSVLSAARQHDVIIPTLCDHPDLHPFGGCRLCLVEVKGSRLPQTACTLLCAPGMIVKTETPALKEARRSILRLLLSNYYDESLLKRRKARTEFEHWLKVYGVKPREDMLPAARAPIDADPNPFVWVDMNKCILCSRCIRACSDVQGRFVWGLAQRGFNTHVVAGMDTTMLDARCESCGACVAYCPTGALDNKLSIHLGEPDRLVTTTCTYCGVGCQIDLNIKDEKIIRVTSNPNAPVNGMHLCVKGRYGYDFVHHPDRLLRPRVRRYLLEDQPRPPGRGEWVETDWPTALRITAEKLRLARDQQGPDSIGVLTSAKCTNEENYLMNKFARQVVGTNNIDHCARL